MQRSRVDRSKRRDTAAGWWGAPDATCSCDTAATYCWDMGKKWEKKGGKEKNRIARTHFSCSRWVCTWICLRWGTCMVLFVFRDLHLPRYQWLFLVYYILTYISYIERDNLLYYGIVLYCIQQLMCIRQKRTENTNTFTVAFRDRETTIFDPVRVFLSTHRWSQKTVCQHCFYKPSRKCHPSQWVSTTPLETVTPRASEEGTTFDSL